MEIVRTLAGDDYKKAENRAEGGGGMGGFLKLILSLIGITFLIREMTEVTPEWVQLLAYSLIIAGWVARKED